MKHHLLSNNEISMLCQELSLLLHAGVGIGDGLALLAEGADSATSRDFLEQMARDVDEGASLSAAFRACNRFPHYVCALLEVGERAGRTEACLAALSRYYENRMRMDHRLRAALLYPCVLLLIMLVVVVVLLTQVLPIFNAVYADLGGRLTGVAGGLLALGLFLDRWMPVLFTLLGVVLLGMILFCTSDPFRRKVLGWWRASWGDRGISGKMNAARFAQSLSMGLSSGLPTEEAITLSAQLLDDVPVAKKRVLDCQLRLQQGASLAQAMGDTGILPKAQSRLLHMGLRSGLGDSVMEQISQRLFEESEAALESSVARVEPTMVIITSVLVGVILLSVMLPLMNIMAVIG